MRNAVTRPEKTVKKDYKITPLLKIASLRKSLIWFLVCMSLAKATIRSINSVKIASILMLWNNRPESKSIQCGFCRRWLAVGNQFHDRYKTAVWRTAPDAEQHTMWQPAVAWAPVETASLPGALRRFSPGTLKRSPYFNTLTTLL